MNIDLTFSLSIFGYWLRVTILELDMDPHWGYSLGICRITVEGPTNPTSRERSLLFINKTIYMSKFDLAFLKLYEKYR